MSKIMCPNCGNECFGFWKYGDNHACSLKCYRKLVKQGKIKRLNPDVAHPELGILPPKRKNEEE